MNQLRSYFGLFYLAFIFLSDLYSNQGCGLELEVLEVFGQIRTRTLKIFGLELELQLESKLIRKLFKSGILSINLFHKY